MKNFTRMLMTTTMLVLVAISAYSQDVFKVANVGIGTVSPTQKLDVVGNVQFTGALMPGSAAGTAGNILLSAGAGVAPAWLANGANGSVLTINASGVPTWVTPVVAAAGWALTGNTGTTYGTNFVGTTDNNSLLFKVYGQVAGRIETSSNTSSTSLGYEALNSNTGTPNTAFGYQALENNTTGYDDVAIGYQAMQTSSASSIHQNTAVGDYAMQNASGGIYANAAFGLEAGQNFSGNYNIAIGNSAIQSNTGSFNIGIGVTALRQGAGSYNIGIGQNSLYNDVSGAYNTMIGYNTGSTNSVTGNYNNALGYSALNNISSGGNNDALGYEALENNTSGSSNDAIGYQANYTLTTGANNTSIGFAANWSNSTGNDDVAIGDSAAWGNTAGGIVAIGPSALRANTAIGNVAVGENALQKNTTGGGATTGNTAVGYDALENNTTTSQNNAFGFKTLSGNTSGQDNIAIGDLALNISQSASYNIAIGTDVMSSFASGNYNVVIGEQALSQSTGTSNNTGVGAFVLYDDLTGSDNVGEGTGVLYHNNGNYNTAIGWQACSTNTISGSNNVALGANALNNLTSGANNTVLGYQANISSGALSNAIAIGANASAPNSNTMVLGNTTDTALYLPGYATRGELFYTSETTGDVAALAPGTSGQVLTISATGVPTWASAGGSGTVTSVATGTGLTGGTITTSGTISLANGTSSGQVLVTGGLPYTPTLQTMSRDAIIGTTGLVTVQGIQTIPVSSTAPTTGNILAYSGTQWLPTTGGSTGQFLEFNASGVPLWITPTMINSISVTSPVNMGGTPSNPNIYLAGTNGGVLYGTGSGVGFTGVGVSGQILESTGAGAPQWVNVSTLDTITGDEWGNQYVITDSISSGAIENTITGTGLGTNPIRLAKQGAKNGQVLTWDSTANTWQPSTPSGTGWQLTGNSGITPGTEFVGTTDTKDLVFKTDDNEDMRISNSNGYVGMGTPSPQAALDVASSSSGILIPRLAANPASPATAMMYYNTTSGCFMFYSGSTWQAIVCGCPNVPAAGTITSSTGSANFCPGTTGITYSITPLSNATGYQWTVPTGFTITSGQGSTSITVTTGTSSGNVGVTPSNNCGTGTASTLAVTPITTNITGQPANASVSCSGGNVTFTVTATGGSLTYQWMVSTNGGTSWSAVSNGGVYSNAQTASLTISSPPTTMNDYEYECVVTGTCTFTSNAATLTVSGLSSVPITITNNQSTATLANLDVMLTINFSTFAADGENTNLNNVEFSTGGGGTGTPLYAWIESGSAPTSSTSTETAPTSSSTTAVVWVNLGSNTIAANGGTLNIYMTFMPSAVMTSTTSYTGMAPQWTSTYGQYDNGTLVFPSFYDNFAGTTLASKWSTTSGTTTTINNKLTMTASHNWYGIYTNTFSTALNNIAESYCELTGSGGLCINTSGTNGNGINNGTDGVDAQLDDQSGQAGFGGNGSCTTAPGTNAQNQTYTPSASTFYLYSFFMLTTPVSQLSYGLLNSLTCLNQSGASGPISSTSEVGLGVSSATGNFQWFRIRSYPPSGVLPGASVGTYGCY